MSTTFISRNIWPTLTSEVRSTRRPCAVAVAYFGAGASRLLPLAKNSRLVVDASERAVASGQTCPLDLVKMVERGVKVYSVPNLHAKVFVVGRTAFIGSANVSGRSASQLVEAVVRTTEPDAVRAAQRFVRDHCLHELTPAALARLATLYRPPKVPRGKRGKGAAAETSQRPTLPRLVLAQLKWVTWSERDQELHDSALVVAKKRREHPRRFVLESFRQSGACVYRRGDLVVLVTEEDDSRVMVAPPGTVLHVRTRRDGNRRTSFVYLERPALHERSVSAIARALGGDAQKRLRRNGLVRSADFARALLKVWS